GQLVLSIGGRWTVESVKWLDSPLRRLSSAGIATARFDLAGLQELDTAGAWLIERTRRALAAAGVSVTIGGARPDHARLLRRIGEAGALPPVAHARRRPIIDFVAALGEGAVDALRQTRDLVGFFGLVIVTGLRVI